MDGTPGTARPTINSYMAANALAIARIAEIAGRDEMARNFAEQAEALRVNMIQQLWDAKAKFFKVQLEDGSLSNAREAIGFVPWMFGLAEPQHGEAWLQIKDQQGFWAPWGLTTAERRHPQFRTHGTGTCEWDGAVWPFATSQTLTGMANYLRSGNPQRITRRDYFEQLLTYARAHEKDGKVYLGEYQDELTGQWLITGPKAQRSRFYNHSTFNDLVITGLVGVVPRADNQVVVDPLIPNDAWDWFCLDGLPYHGCNLTVIWDRDGSHYGRGAGFSLWADQRRIAISPSLMRLAAELPEGQN